MPAPLPPPPEPLPLGSDGQPVPRTTDPYCWADTFCDRMKRARGIDLSSEAVAGWFAKALATGFEDAVRTFLAREVKIEGFAGSAQRALFERTAARATEPAPAPLQAAPAAAAPSVPPSAPAPLSPTKPYVYVPPPQVRERMKAPPPPAPRQNGPATSVPCPSCGRNVKSYKGRDGVPRLHRHSSEKGKVCPASHQTPAAG